MSSMLEVRGDRRSRSKSPSGRDGDRSRSRSHDARESYDIRESRRQSKNYSYPETESEDDRRYKEKKSSKKYYESDEEDDRRRGARPSKYADDSDKGDRHGSSRLEPQSRRRDVSVSDDNSSRYDRSKKKSDSDSDRHRHKPSRTRYAHSGDSASDDDDRHIPQTGRSSYGHADTRPQDSRHSSYVGPDPRYAPPSAAVAGTRYAELDQYKYAEVGKEASYKYKESSKAVPAQYAERKPEYDRSRPSKDKEYHRDSFDRRELKDKRYHEDKYETREPKGKKYYDDTYDARDKKYREDKYGSSPEDVTKRMSALAVGGATLGAATLGVARHNSHNGGRPPASPLLEAYKGTYQSISPMPSPLALAKQHRDDSELSDLDLELDQDDSDSDSDDAHADLKRKIRQLEREKQKISTDPKRSSNRDGSSSHEVRPRGMSNLEATTTSYEIREPGGRRDRANSNVSIMSTGGNGERKNKKVVSFYDPTEDAQRIAAALSGTRHAADPRPLIQILPYLSTDDLLALRAEYKNHAKVSGQGINMAKHIKMRVPGNLGKAAYATALGRWESEAYWANSWYQGGASRRELLIESLMGRSNSDIREIKNCFKDKKYSDDLDKCIRTELRADKFRMAILLALEERRMPESSALDIRLVRDDVHELAAALDSPGGETDMIKIIVLRSDAHLREVLRLFERTYRVNFARQMIVKSRNLVGETLAHILNGALNRPMRDALLLHQAISETAPGKERTELLISRLVRMHWEPRHLEKVKAVFGDRYGRTVEDAVMRDVWTQMKTPEGRLCAEFCVALVQSSSGSGSGNELADRPR
ncbi:hypothetical protein A1O1_05871 [Capronia coronata CBS 617.96]|uniref:Annexin n=1 Tax=Capronia coronata CBS 617.96 TaxID=1182541 RepID=W9XY98_9EURO|nr:uncharacterized protein A1O1_05871 [Capronia coronata CBS 617.96]EXJ85507.1 hypothetical protein A1O1_05871 [Capronia coronata CBS 617.96]